MKEIHLGNWRRQNKHCRLNLITNLCKHYSTNAVLNPNSYTLLRQQAVEALTGTSQAFANHVANNLCVSHQYFMDKRF